jgi:ornithine cyclodeaminase/alanine dehydrogenase-like protein (mu-crystallin family)
VTLLYLSREEVALLLPAIPEQLDLVERTYRELAAGRVELPPKPGIHPRKDSFIHAMPAYLVDSDVAALKWVAGYPKNKERGLPYVSGLIVVNDADTGLPLAVMDGAEITAARTAAASGVCVRRWAPTSWSEAAILGCGEQGRFHARMLRALNPALHVRAFDPHPDRIEQLDGPVDAVDGPRAAVTGAHVLVTAGPIVEAPEPSITSDWFGDTFLALPIDFDFYFSAEAIGNCDLFLVDDVGQFDYYRGLGHFKGWPAPAKSVGEALVDGDEGKRVACVNLGIGALDAAFANHVLGAASQRGVGRELSL